MMLLLQGLFRLVLSLSLAGGFATLLVMGARVLARDRLGPRWDRYGWMLPLALYLVPVILPRTAPAQQGGGGEPRGGGQIALSAEDRRPSQGVPIGRLPDALGEAGLPRNGQRLLLVHISFPLPAPRGGCKIKSILSQHTAGNQQKLKKRIQKTLPVKNFLKFYLKFEESLLQCAGFPSIIDFAKAQFEKIQIYEYRRSITREQKVCLSLFRGQRAHAGAAGRQGRQPG